MKNSFHTMNTTPTTLLCSRFWGSQEGLFAPNRSDPSLVSLAHSLKQSSVG
jgi:hypothetical protein